MIMAMSPPYIYLSQEFDIQQLLQDNNLHAATTITKPNPYHSCHPVDTIPNRNIPITAHRELESILCTIIVSLNSWLLSTQKT
jgi:hypothetical protein